MHYLITFIRLILLAVSFYGYIQFLKSKFDIRMEFSFFVTCSSIGSLMVLAGMLNILNIAVAAIFLLGLFFACISLKDGAALKSHIGVSTVFLGIMLIFMLFLLRGERFIRYDNFSHWATVVKLMLANGRFPSFKDSVIGFQSYPLGSSSFIYYFVKVTGINGEWMYMYSQTVLILSAVLCLFAFVKKNKLIGNIFAVVFVLFLICSNIRFTDLYVDTLLTVVGVAGMAIVCYYRTTISQKCWLLLPVVTFLMMIKNSGIFFVLMIGIYYLIVVEKRRAVLGRSAIIVLSPFFMLLLWQKHVDYAFYGGMSAKHSMSVQNFESVFSGKTVEDIQTILTKMTHRIFSFSNGFLYCVILMLLLLLIAKRMEKSVFRELLSLSIYLILSYIGYLLGLAAMYLFSMPTNEAVRLASYGRYHITMVGFVAGVLCIEVLLVINHLEHKEKKRICSVALAVIALAASYICLKPQFYYFKKQEYEGTQRQKFDEIVAENLLPMGSTYVVLCETESDYVYHMARYLFLSGYVAAFSEDELDNIGDAWQNYDYLVVLENTEEIQEYVTENFGADNGNVIALAGYK